MDVKPHSSIPAMDQNSSQSGQECSPFEFVLVKQEYSNEGEAPQFIPDMKPDIEIVDIVDIKPKIVSKNIPPSQVIKPKIESVDVASGSQTKVTDVQLASNGVSTQMLHNNFMAPNVSLTKQIPKKPIVCIDISSPENEKNITQKQSEPKTSLQNNNKNCYKYPKCSDCNIIFKDKAELEMHLGYSVSSTKYTIVLTTLDQFESQQTQYPANCNSCRKNNVQDSTFHSHLNSESLEQKYICRVCTKTFIFQCQLKKHVIYFKHAGFKEIRPKIQEIQSRNSAEECDTISALKCPYCVLYFEDSCELEAHLGMYPGSIICSENGNATVSPHQSAPLGIEIGTIERVEVNENKYDEQDEPKQCEICSLKFINLVVLNDHKCNHEELEHPYTCDMIQCTRKFIYLCQLSKHKMKHKHRDNLTQARKKYVTKNNKSDKFNCPLCGSKYTNNDSLKYHINQMHDNHDRFNENFTAKNSKSVILDSSKTLYDALQSSIDKIQFICEHCSLKFNDRVDLIRHNDEEHNESNVVNNSSNNVTKTAETHRNSTLITRPATSVRPINESNVVNNLSNNVTKTVGTYQNCIPITRPAITVRRINKSNAVNNSSNNVPKTAETYRNSTPITRSATSVTLINESTVVNNSSNNVPKSAETYRNSTPITRPATSVTLINESTVVNNSSNNVPKSAETYRNSTPITRPATSVRRSNNNNSEGPPHKISKFNVIQETTETSTQVVPQTSTVTSSNNTPFQDFTSIISKNSEINVHQCPFCLKYFRSQSNLLEFRTHLNLNKKCDVHNYKVTIPLTKFEHQLKFQCDNCQLTHTNFELYALHKQTHITTTSALIKCRVCSESQSFTCSLIKHQREVLHDVDIYECSICSSKFCNTESMREHVRTVHIGLMKLHCQVCKEKSRNHIDLQKHFLEKHKIKNMTSFSEMIGVYIDKDGFNKCNLCQLSYRLEETLEKHYESFHHCKKPMSISCPLCEQKFSKLCFVNQHVALCHSDFSFLKIAAKRKPME